MSHLNNGKLAVKYRSTKKLCEPPIKITDAQRDSILSILHNNYTVKQYNNLKSEDKELIYNFVVKTQAKNVEFITHTDSLKNKFEVLCGELATGNDAPEIRKMLRDTAERLVNNKAITRFKYLSIISQL